MSNMNIKVVTRLRPENQMEREIPGHKVCVTNNANSIRIEVESEKKTGGSGVHEFTFDRIFGPDSKQQEVFDYTAKPIIQSVLDGYNGTIICYGQTSSGKTFTMEGIIEDENMKGIIPRMIDFLFESINSSSDEIEFSVKCSFLEIYNEKIQDLLEPSKSNLLIKEGKDKGIWIQDSTEIYVSSKTEMNEVFKTGIENRAIGQTKMNDRSSRSHSIFMLTVFQRNNQSESTKSGKLYLIDLAGSEKMSKTVVSSNLIEETKNINKSLMCLGMVINSLSEGKTNEISYRDSKLTRILQESFGGNSLTVFINTVSMSSYNDKETLSTLRFGYRAKTIKNKPIENSEKSAKELTFKLKEADEKIKVFEKILQEMQSQIDMKKGSKVCTSFNNESTEMSSFRNEKRNEVINMCEDCGNAMVKILNQQIEISSLNDEIDSLRAERGQYEDEIKIRNEEIFELNENLLNADSHAKLFINEQLNLSKEIQARFESLFVENQRKLIEIIEIKEHLFEFKENALKIKNQNQIENSYEKFLAFNLKAILTIEELLFQVQDLENWSLKFNQDIDEMTNFFSHKNSVLTIENFWRNISVSREGSEISVRDNYNTVVEKDRIGKFKKETVILNEEVYEKNQNLDLQRIFLKRCKSSSGFNDKISKKKIEKNMTIDLTYSRSKMDNDLIISQRHSLLEMSNQYKIVKEALYKLQYDFRAKEEEVFNLEESCKIKETKIDKLEEKLKLCLIEKMEKEREFQEYKEKTLIDFAHKEKQILDLHNKISDLEDEKFRLLHFSKDKDKKKFHAMEIQIKQFTVELEKLLQETSRLKSIIDKKEEENRIIYEKNIELDKKLMEVTKVRSKEVINNQILINCRIKSRNHVNEGLNNSKNNSSHSSNSNQSPKGKKIMKVIKGGNSFNSENTHNQNKNNDNKPNSGKYNVENNNYLLRNDNCLESNKRDKIEYEMKILEEDFVDENYEKYGNINEVKKDKKEDVNNNKKGIFDIFSKLKILQK